MSHSLMLLSEVARNCFFTELSLEMRNVLAYKGDHDELFAVRFPYFYVHLPEVIKDLDQYDVDDLIRYLHRRHNNIMPPEFDRMVYLMHDRVSEHGRYFKIHGYVMPWNMFTEELLKCKEQPKS